MESSTTNTSSKQQSVKQLIDGWKEQHAEADRIRAQGLPVEDTSRGYVGDWFLVVSRSNGVEVNLTDLSRFISAVTGFWKRANGGRVMGTTHRSYRENFSLPVDFNREGSDFLNTTLEQQYRSVMALGDDVVLDIPVHFNDFPELPEARENIILHEDENHIIIIKEYDQTSDINRFADDPKVVKNNTAYGKPSIMNKGAVLIDGELIPLTTKDKKRFALRWDK